MIKRIELRNFQRHAHLSIEPATGVTVIVGQSHAGKSAIMRAINWVVFNKPSGGSFIRHGSETASVSIETEKGVVTRTKSTKGKNEYKIEQPGADPILLTGFGQNVPESVVRFFNMEEINFQPQMSLPFLICSSGGEINRKLNQIANLNKIDTTLAELGRISRQTVSDLSNARSRMEGAFSIIKSLTWLDNAEERLKKMETIVSAIKQFGTQRDQLAKALKGIAKATETPTTVYRQTLHALEYAAEQCAKLQEEGRRKDQLIETYNHVVRVFNKIQKAEQTLAEAKKAATHAEKALEEAMPDGTCPVCGSLMRGSNAIHTHS